MSNRRSNGHGRTTPRRTPADRAREASVLDLHRALNEARSAAEVAAAVAELRADLDAIEVQAVERLMVDWGYMWPEVAAGYGVSAPALRKRLRRLATLCGVGDRYPFAVQRRRPRRASTTDRDGSDSLGA